MEDTLGKRNTRRKSQFVPIASKPSPVPNPPESEAVGVLNKRVCPFDENAINNVINYCHDDIIAQYKEWARNSNRVTEPTEPDPA